MSRDGANEEPKGFAGLQSLASDDSAGSDAATAAEQGEADEENEVDGAAIDGQDGPQPSYVGIWIFLAACVAFFLFAYGSYHGGAGNPSSRAGPTSSPGKPSVSADALDATPLDVPRTQQLLDRSVNSESFIEVHTRAGGSHTVVKIEDLYGNVAAEGFIRGGGRLKLYVPLGTYVIKTASGMKWFGWERLFGPDTRYSRPDDTFPLSQPGEYWTVELIPQARGNIQDRAISASEF